MTMPPGPAESRSDGGPTLKELEKVVGKAAPASLFAELHTRGASTLADVRRLGGLTDLASGRQAGAARLVEAHADLASLSADLEANSALIEGGITNVSDIARRSPSDFLMVAAPLVGVEAATRLHVQATALASAIDQLGAGARVDSQNGLGGTLPAQLDAAVSPRESRRCECNACQAAPSPAAYLADLMAYVIKHLKNRHQPITLDFLVGRFCQPFGDLPTDCEAVERRVRQVRICCEVLRQYLRANPPSAALAAALATAEAAYRLGAYRALLAALGTTYEELRLAQRALADARRQLASRLGIPIDPVGSARPDALDVLLLDPTAVPPAPNALTEGTLERLFGLADTTRNPLSDSIALGDTTPLITRWNLHGVAWGRTTDADGLVHVTLSHDGATFFRVALYRDSARTQLVSSGEQHIAGGVVSGTVTVTEENSSGLSGEFALASPTDDATIALSVIPQLTAWRLQTLRAAWAAADAPDDPFRDGVSVTPLAALPPGVTIPPGLASRLRFDAGAGVLILDGVLSPDERAQLDALSADVPYLEAVAALYLESQRRPVIDPDVIGPDDFRSPVAKAKPADPDQPFDVWMRRRTWADTELNALSGITKVVKGKKVPDFDGLLAAMYTTVTYGASTVTPWESTTPVTALENIWEEIGEGVSVSEHRTRIGADLALDLAAFGRLIELRHRDASTLIDPQTPPLGDAEWREVRAILLSAIKHRLAQAWRAEESATTVVFGGEAFVESLREPTVGDWPPVRAATEPLIDPSIIGINDLPESGVGGRALDFWQARTVKLTQITAKLRTTRESAGFTAMLREALGDPSPGNPLPANIDTLAQQLADPDPMVAAAAAAKVRSLLFLSVEDFRRVMAVRTMDAEPDPLAKPSAADWLDVYAILTSAEKEKREYPTWLTEEAAAATGVVYWTARKAALPPWRAALDDRAEWHEALAKRTRTPTIEPDLLTPLDLVDQMPGTLAFDIWQARTTWMQGQLTTPLPATVADFDAAVLASLEVDSAALMSIAIAREAGADVTPRLQQLGLTMEAFDRVLAVRAFIDAGSALLASEWDDVVAILAQAVKVRRYADWVEEERTQHVVLGPDMFVMPDSMAEPTPLPAWRATRDLRDAWEDGLRARIEQQDTTVAGVADAVDSAESATLPDLRDALVLATGSPGSNLAEEADWITTQLMIDARMSGCQFTTRIEQAIETLQTAMTGVRDGQIGSFDISLSSAPAAACAWGVGRIDLFVRGGDNAVWHRMWDGGWHDWESIGGVVTSAPAAAAAGTGSLEVFARGTDNALWHRRLDGTSWGDWESLGGILISAPAATSSDGSRVDVVVVGTDAALWRRALVGGAWTAWEPIARTAPFPTGGLSGSPAVACSTSGTLDVFSRGGDSALWHASVDTGGVWSGWESLGGSITSDPAATSAAPSTVDVFARGGDMAVWQRSWQLASGWASWTSLGGFTLQGPAVSSWGGGRLDVFAEGPDSSMWRRWFDGVWHPWEATDALTIDAPDFDEEWKWMGSYATWRAAILVTMYCENLLDGRLRKWQTPAYQKLVAFVQSVPALTPAQARDAACTYSQYYRDVCSITVEASCRVWSRLDTGVGCTEAANPQRGWLLDMFGRAKHSNRAYWSSYDETDTTGYPQSFWDVVPGLDGQDLQAICASTPFWVSAGKRYVFLFFIALDHGAQRLRFTRYDPEVRGQGGWEQITYDLALRPEWSNVTARLGYQAGEGDPPRIIVTLPDGSAYGRQLNRDGTDWSAVDWVRLGLWIPWKKAGEAPVMGGTPLAVVSRVPEQLDIFWSDMFGAVYSVWANDYVNNGLLSGAFRIDNGFAGGGPVSAIARTPNHLDLFVVDAGGTVMNSWWDAGVDGGAWHAFGAISPPNTAASKSEVAVVARTPDHLDVFVTSADGHIWSTWWDGSWAGWFSIGDPSYTTWNKWVKACARGPNHLDVFMIDTKGRIRQNQWDGATGTPWSSKWESIAQGGFAVSPESSLMAIVTSTPDRIDMVINGDIRADGTAMTFWSWVDFHEDLGMWHGFQNVSSKTPARFGAAISAVGRFPTQVDLFTVGQRPAGPGGATTVWSAWHNNTVVNWQDFFSIGDDGGDIMNAQPWGLIPAISRIPSRIELFAPLFGGSTSKPGAIYTTYWQDAAAPTPSPQLPPFPPVPNVSGPLDIPDHMSSPDLQTRRVAIALAYAGNPGAPRSTMTYLEEAYYFVPMLLAGQLQRAGEYVAALDWYRTVYDYSMPVALRNIYYGFELEKSLPAVGTRLPDWLLDPLNPHLIAATRRYAYARYTILQIAQCFRDFGDARFTFDTAESDAQARTLYMTELALLGLDIFQQSAYPCEGLLIQLGDSLVSDPKWKWVLRMLRQDLATIAREAVVKELVSKLEHTLAADAPWPDKLRTARAQVQEAQRQVPLNPRVAELLAHQDQVRQAVGNAVRDTPGLQDALARVPAIAGSRFDDATNAWLAGNQLDSVGGSKGANGAGVRRLDTPALAVRAIDEVVVASTVKEKEKERQRPKRRAPASNNAPLEDAPPDMNKRLKFFPGVLADPNLKFPRPPRTPTVPVVSYWFCTPPNPLLTALRSQAELNLYKLRHCMNIAGVHRQVDPYAAPTDVSSGLPSIGSGGQLVIPGAVVLQPTPYHYEFLVEHSKQLAQLAAQFEAAMLAARASSDREAYDELKARQDMALANATVQLQDLRVKQATDGVSLAQLQQDRAQVQSSHWSSLLAGGVSDLENDALQSMYIEAGLQVASAAMSAAAAVQSGFSPEGVFSFGAESSSNVATSLSSTASSFGTMASIQSARASYERRREDWEYQQSLAVEDQRIAATQVLSAQDQLRVVGQERNIAQLHADHTAAVVDFLTHKFTNAALYEWMSAVLQQVYAFFLRQATAMARLAEAQLAFQRQEVPPGYVKADYWQVTAASGADVPSGDTAGLTGSARLLQDIYALDQYAIDTNKRKLQLSKTISLSQLDPAEFQRLRTEGIMQFATPMSLFDRDFPGHYVRLIRRVRTTVVALIPPTEGIKATLSTTAATRVVIGPDVFQKTVVRRDPQSVALTAPTNATGVFDLDPQSDLLLPFEGLGLEAHWEFRMPKASNALDYRSVADVLLTFEYTALHSDAYAAEVVRALGRRASSERPFSFRNELADQWYDLHNPDQSPTPMSVTFTTNRDDFPANLTDLRVEQLMLGFVRADGATFEVPVRALQFSEQGSTGHVGGAAASFGGLISTRHGNAASWTAMIGKTPFGDWTLQLPNTAVVRGWFDDDRVIDIVFSISYSARIPEWPV